MDARLDRDEERFVCELMDCGAAYRDTWFTEHVFLFLGGAVFVAAALYTVFHLSDRVAVWVMIPGALFSVIMFVLYLFESRWVAQRRLMAGVLKKVMDGPKN